jgi:hypothetical protein
MPVPVHVQVKYLSAVVEAGLATVVGAFTVAIGLLMRMTVIK